MPTGKFIVIEGADGSGKSTQQRLLCAALEEHFGKDRVTSTREPGGSPFAEELRAIVLGSSLAKHVDGKTMMLLFFAARADHLLRRVRPSLEEGRFVVSDRFDASTFAYQIFGQEQVELERLFGELRLSIVSETEPDRYFILDAPAEVCFARVNTRGDGNHFDERGIEFHRRLREGYQVFARRHQRTVRIIDANRPAVLIHQELFR